MSFVPIVDDVVDSSQLARATPSDSLIVAAHLASELRQRLNPRNSARFRWPACRFGGRSTLMLSGADAACHAPVQARAERVRRHIAVKVYVFTLDDSDVKREYIFAEEHVDVAIDDERDDEQQPSRGERNRRVPGEADPVPDAERMLAPLDLGQRLAIARQGRGLTQKDFSELVGKSRATIIQYEQGRLQPPLQQIETMARVLGVAPELIAFGRQGITGLPADSSNVTSIPEVERAGHEGVVSGGHGFGQGLVDHLGIEPENARVYVLAEAAPHFGLGKGDRIIVNDMRELSQANRLYAFRTPGGVAVARLLPALSSSSDRVNLNGGHGETTSYEPGELLVLGLVVGTIQAR